MERIGLVEGTRGADDEGRRDERLGRALTSDPRVLAAGLSGQLPLRLCNECGELTSLLRCCGWRTERVSPAVLAFVLDGGRRGEA